VLRGVGTLKRLFLETVKQAVELETIEDQESSLPDRRQHWTPALIERAPSDANVGERLCLTQASLHP